MIVGDVGMELERTPLYEKEVTIRLARSYGPGRYERAYEEWGIDYPVGQVRWTEGRNIEAVLDLLAGGRCPSPTSSPTRTRWRTAKQAYETIEGGHGPFVGGPVPVPARGRRRPHTHGVTTPKPIDGQHRHRPPGCRQLRRATMMPILEELGGMDFVAVASAGGTSARHLAERHGFDRVATDASDCDQRPRSRPGHDRHAPQHPRRSRRGSAGGRQARLLREATGHHAWTSSTVSRMPTGPIPTSPHGRLQPPMVTDGPGGEEAARASRGGPLVISYRVNAGALPAKPLVQGPSRRRSSDRRGVPLHRHLYAHRWLGGGRRPGRWVSQTTDRSCARTSRCCCRSKMGRVRRLATALAPSLRARRK